MRLREVVTGSKGQVAICWMGKMGGVVGEKPLMQLLGEQLKEPDSFVSRPQENNNNNNTERERERETN